MCIVCSSTIHASTKRYQHQWGRYWSEHVWTDLQSWRPDVTNREPGPGLWPGKDGMGPCTWLSPTVDRQTRLKTGHVFFNNLRTIFNTLSFVKRWWRRLLSLISLNWWVSLVWQSLCEGSLGGSKPNVYGSVLPSVIYPE